MGEKRHNSAGRLTFRCSCRGPASVRQPSCLLYRERDSVTPVAVRASLASGHALQPARRGSFGTRNRPRN